MPIRINQISPRGAAQSGSPRAGAEAYGLRQAQAQLQLSNSVGYNVEKIYEAGKTAGNMIRAKMADRRAAKAAADAAGNTPKPGANAPSPEEPEAKTSASPEEQEEDLRRRAALAEVEAGRQYESADMLSKQMQYSAALDKFDASYRQTRQGKNALSAQADYEAKAAELQKEYAASFGNAMQAETWRQQVWRRTSAFVGNGIQHQLQQEAGWKNAQLGTCRATAMQAAASPHATDEQAVAAFEEYRAAANAINPERAARERQQDKNDFYEARRESVARRVLELAAADPVAAWEYVSGPSVKSATGLNPATGAAEQDNAELGPDNVEFGYGNIAWNKSGASGNNGGAVPPNFQRYFTPKEYAALHGKVSKALSDSLEQDDASRKTAQDWAEKEIYARRAQGTLEQTFLEDARDVLSPAAYSAGLSLLAGGPAGAQPPSDPGALLALWDMAADGDVDFQNTADDMYKNGRITVADYKSLSGSARQLGDPVEKQIASNMRATLGYSAAKLDPAAGASLVAARQEYYAWRGSEAGAKAAPQERLEMAGRIAQNRRAADLQKAIGYKAPLYLAGGASAPDIKKTIEKTSAAYRAGRLSKGQYAQECARIRALARFFEQQGAGGKV